MSRAALPVVGRQPLPPRRKNPMNASLASERSLDRTGQRDHTLAASHRIGALDRLTLRLGLWLLLRGARNVRRAHDHVAHEQARAAARARAARDTVTVDHLMRAHRA